MSTRRGASSAAPCPISPLYLPYISPISPLYLPYISPISPLYLRHLRHGLLVLAQRDCLIVVDATTGEVRSCSVGCSAAEVSSLG